MNFKKNFLFLITSKELTVNFVSKELDIPQTTLNDYAIGTAKDIKLSNAIKISRYFKVSLDDLVFKDLSKDNK